MLEWKCITCGYFWKEALQYLQAIWGGMGGVRGGGRAPPGQSTNTFRRFKTTTMHSHATSVPARTKGRSFANMKTSPRALLPAIARIVRIATRVRARALRAQGRSTSSRRRRRHGAISPRHVPWANRYFNRAPAFARDVATSGNFI
jgi:hypothetical protein